MTKTAAEITQSEGFMRSGYVNYHFTDKWTQAWAILDAGGDCAVICLCRGKGDVRPTTVLALSHFSTDLLDAAEVQGPTDFAFEVLDPNAEGGPRRHLFCVESAADRDAWVDTLSVAVGSDDRHGYTDMTGMTNATDVTDAMSELSFVSYASSVPLPAPEDPYPGAPAVQGPQLYPPATTTAQLAGGMVSAGPVGFSSHTEDTNGVRNWQCLVVKEDGPELGMIFESRTEPSGVGSFYVIKRVEPGSVASRKGLQTGMELRRVQQQTVAELDAQSVRRLLGQRPLHIVAAQHSIPATDHLDNGGSKHAGARIDDDGRAPQLSQGFEHQHRMAELRCQQLERALELEQERAARVKLTDAHRQMMEDQEALAAINQEMQAQLTELQQRNDASHNNSSDRPLPEHMAQSAQASPQLLHETGESMLAPSVRMIAPAEHQQPGNLRLVD